LENTFPHIFKNAEVTKIYDYSLIIKIAGSDESLLPAGFLAHQDVVPAPSEGWEVPPFSGEITDEFVYGRGSMDMKGQMIAVLAALDKILEEGRKPKRTIYCCFGHDEEYTGKEGALNIVEHLAKKGIKFEYVIDEGGIVLDGGLVGVDGRIALIGICEKGYVDIGLEVEKAGGHASSPTARTAVGKLCEAVYDVETTPMKATWTQPTKDMFKALAPYMKPLFKFFIVNRDILSPLLKFVFSKVHPVTKSLLCTTFAPTMLSGATAPNVLPPKAFANINCRINTNETIEDVVKHIKKVVGKDVKVTIQPGSIDPTEVSDITSPAYRELTRTISEVFPGYVTAPYPFIAATDAKYYYALTKNVYRFTPFYVTEEDQSRIHAINERCNKADLKKAAEFFHRLMERTCL
jgi:carboxypeptidase PM20D1